MGILNVEYSVGLQIACSLCYRPYVTDAVNGWMNIVESTGTTDGIDILWSYILTRNNTDPFIYSKPTYQLNFFL